MRRASARRPALLQFLQQMLGVSLVFLEQREAGFQQRLQLAIVGARDERVLERAVDGGVIGDLVLDIGLVERRAFQRCEALKLVVGLLRSEEHTSELQSLMRISYA